LRPPFKEIGLTQGLRNAVHVQSRSRGDFPSRGFSSQFNERLKDRLLTIRPFVHLASLR
jgi:hypothetical protein